MNLTESLIRVKCKVLARCLYKSKPSGSGSMRKHKHELMPPWNNMEWRFVCGDNYGHIFLKNIPSLGIVGYTRVTDG